MEESMSSLRRSYCVIMPQYHSQRREIEDFLKQRRIKVTRSFEKRFPRREEENLREELPGCLVDQRSPEGAYVIIHVEADNLSQRFYDIRWHTVPGTNKQFRDVCFWPTSDVSRFTVRIIHEPCAVARVAAAFRNSVNKGCGASGRA